MKLSLRAAAAIALLAGAATAHAGLFDDDEARKAILDLRQRITAGDEAQRQRTADLAEVVNQMKRSLLDLNSQLEQQRADNAALRGQQEQLARAVAELQRQVKDMQQGVDERMRRIEPQKTVVDGREVVVDPEEKRQFDQAVGVLRAGDFPNAANGFANFLRRWPGSGYRESALFWLGNAQYGKRDYKEAMASFRALVNESPQHPRAAESLLSIANCQIELKDIKGARRTIDELIKAYPQSEAAAAGRERLPQLR